MSPKTALLLIDIQPSFVRTEDTRILKNIEKLLREKSYDAYIEVVFSAPAGSIWDKQMDWTFPKEDTIPEIKNLIQRENYLFIEKTTKSAFKGNTDLYSFLKEKGIEEVHIIGFDTNDCVLATAYEAFDLGFLSYVVKDCTGASQSQEMREYALTILEGSDMVK